MPRKVTRKEADETVVEVPIDTSADVQPAKRGRKLKYESDEERRQARRLQNKQYRERKKQELDRYKGMESLPELVSPFQPYYSPFQFPGSREVAIFRETSSPQKDISTVYSINRKTTPNFIADRWTRSANSTAVNGMLV